MSCEVHVRFCERREVRLLPATHRVVLVAGDHAHAETLRNEAAAVLSTMGLRLSLEKTRIAHIDEGFDFRGRHIQRPHQTRNEATARLHLPLEERDRVDQGQGAGGYAEDVNEPVAGRPMRPTAPRAVSYT